MAIRNKELLTALDKIVDSAQKTDDVITLSAEQKAMLKMSEDDIKHGRVIPHEDIIKDDLKWLKEL